MDVRTRIMTIRLIEKMKEPAMREYGRSVGIRDVSYLRENQNKEISGYKEKGYE